VQNAVTKPQSHQRLGPEFRRLRLTEADVGEIRAHVVQQQIG